MKSSTRPEIHCRHGDSLCLAEKSKRGAHRILIGDAFHNAGDGFLLAPLFVADIRLGFLAAFGIFVHEFVQEISEFFVLRGAGYTMREALTRNFAVSGTILAGSLAGFFLSSFEALIGPLFGLAAGAFLHILIFDLIPHTLRDAHAEKKYARYTFAPVTGILLIVLVNSLTGHYLEEAGLAGDDHALPEESAAERYP